MKVTTIVVVALIALLTYPGHTPSVGQIVKRVPPLVVKTDSSTIIVDSVIKNSVLNDMRAIKEEQKQEADDIKKVSYENRLLREEIDRLKRRKPEVCTFYAPIVHDTLYKTINITKTVPFIGKTKITRDTL